MSLDFVFSLIDYLLLLTCIFIVCGSLYITLKLRFIQLRLLPDLFFMMKNSQEKKSGKDKEAISPFKALFTAMSTTLGVSTIVAPVIAISLGGPGAVLGFVITAFLGSATTYTEVNLAIQYRKKMPSGKYMGGPMQYLKALISPFAAKWYAIACLMTMVAWSSAQANQLAAIFDSPLLGDYRIPVYVSGAITAVILLWTLFGGVQRIASLSSKLVPVMFSLYLSSCLWILAVNFNQMGAVIGVMFESMFTPYAMATGATVGGLMSALRWGVFKGTQTSEAGVGTQAIPHSMAETNDPVAQGMLAMLSTYSAGIIAFLSGCVAIITNTWQDPTLPLGMSMVAASFEMYFSSFGVTIVAISTLLFGFGTILGNSFNGSQCFEYLSKQKGVRYYYVVAAAMVFLGAISDAKLIWSAIDVVLAFMVVPHMGALIYYTYNHSERMLKETEATLLVEAE